MIPFVICEKCKNFVRADSVYGWYIGKPWCRDCIEKERLLSSDGTV